MELGKPLAPELDKITAQGDSEQIKCITEILDIEINDNLKKWPVNYIAADLLNDAREFSSKYNEDEKTRFEQYVNNKLDQLDGNPVELRQMFLNIYANPVLRMELQRV